MYVKWLQDLESKLSNKLISINLFKYTENLVCLLKQFKILIKAFSLPPRKGIGNKIFNLFIIRFKIFNVNYLNNAIYNN